MTPKFIIYLEFTLPADALLSTGIALSLMDSFQTLRRVFSDLQPVIGTRLLHNTEDPKVVLLEITAEPVAVDVFVASMRRFDLRQLARTGPIVIHQVSSFVNPTAHTAQESVR